MRLLIFVLTSFCASLALCVDDSVPTTAELRTARQCVARGDHLMQESRDALDSARYAPARAAYEQALALDPASTAAMTGLAWVFNSEHRFADGAQWCEKALALEASLPDAYALLADGAVELGHYERAFDWCQRSLDLRPDLASYSRAAHLLWITGHPLRGRKLMEAAIAAGGPTAENTAWCEAQLARMLLLAGERDAANSVLARALPRAPNNPHLLAMAARVAWDRGDIAGAIDCAQRSVAAGPTHEALSDLVDLYAGSGQAAEARRQFARVLAYHASHHAHAGTEPASPHFHGNAQLARFLVDHHQMLDTALGEAEAAWASTPNVGAADALAWCYHELGRHAEAKTMMDSALNWNTPDPELLYHAGVIAAANGDREKARDFLRRALKGREDSHLPWVAAAQAAWKGESD